MSFVKYGNYEIKYIDFYNMENYDNSDLEEHSKFIKNVLNVHKQDLLPINHIAFLEKTLCIIFSFSCL